MQQKQVISCDWGTSSLRLQLMDTASHTCLARVSSANGNAVIYNEWRQLASVDRVEYYLKTLQPLLNELISLAGQAVDALPILISGMASSTVGLKELPYKNVPFRLDGSSAYTEWIDGKPVINNQVLLISGLQQHDDVMRGEETQLVGIASLFDLPKGDNFLFILPGTHSKHVVVENNTIIHFNTFMTGEIFETLTKHTVLSHAVSVSSNNAVSGDEKKSFTLGVSKALNGDLLSSLFSVRINQLKKYLSAEQNYYYLSGLLIGSEIKHLINTNQNLVLCISGSLLELYKMAIDCAGLSGRTLVIPPQVLDNAAAVGQIKILNNIKSN